MRMTVFVIAAVAAHAAWADDAPPCACVAKGKRWAQGDSICLNGRTLTCGMMRNVSAWLTGDQSCVPEQARSDSQLSTAEKNLL